ncbi:unnamed protein product [Coregonus sp. 'balchen']|nr:unnamed protein product [Coregonus sp. 'balchen']
MQSRMSLRPCEFWSVGNYLSDNKRLQHGCPNGEICGDQILGDKFPYKLVSKKIDCGWASHSGGHLSVFQSTVRPTRTLHDNGTPDSKKKKHSD